LGPMVATHFRRSSDDPPSPVIRNCRYAGKALELLVTVGKRARQRWTLMPIVA
jgi:hypothetical protein